MESLLAAPGSAERSLAGGWRARKEYDRLFLERVSGDERGSPRGPAPAGPVPLPVPGVARWGGFEVRAELVSGYSVPDVSCEAYVDGGSLDGPLEVRGPEAGDRLRPLGGPGTRKLQDVLVDLRVPARERPGVPLVVCDNRIVWVGGLVSCEEGRIGRETTTVVRLSLQRFREGGGSVARCVAGNRVAERRGGPE